MVPGTLYVPGASITFFLAVLSASGVLYGNAESDLFFLTACMKYEYFLAPKPDSALNTSMLILDRLLAAQDRRFCVQ